MTIFDLEIRHPHHHSDSEAEFMEDMATQDLMAKFNAMNWKRCKNPHAADARRKAVLR